MSAWHAEWAWLGGDAVVADVLLRAEAGRFVEVSPGVPVPAGARRLRGVTLPGLANGHSHCFHRALRGRTQTGNGSFWTWRDQMYGVAGTLDPDSYFALARATFAEMVLAGMTAVGEFHYVHHQPDGRPYDDPNAIGRALIAAAAEAGIRLTLLDTCYLHGGIDQSLSPAQQRFGDGTAEAWAGRVDALSDSPTVRIGAAIHSVRAVAPGEMAVVRDWAAPRSAVVHAHVSEQPAENEACLARYGRTPVGVLDDAGVLGPSFTAVHATHLSDDDVTRLGASRSTCCLCPTTERDLADGIGPARRLRDHGARLSLGSDSNAVVDLFEEARAVELDERLATNVRGHHAAPDLLRSATADGMASLGWPEAGRLAEGALADLVTVSLGSVRLAGTRPDAAIEGLVYAASAADVSDVVVGGDEVVVDFRHRRVGDVADALTRALEVL